MPEHTVIGTSLAKVDGPERVTGKAAFGADLDLPNMLWAKLVRSPYAHARIKKIDTSKALALPGVKAAITAQDLPPLEKGTTAPLVGEVSIDMSAIRELVIASDKARFHGQVVAAVAATDPFTAEEAAQLVEVEYEQLPVVGDVMQAMQPDAPLVHEDLYTTQEESQESPPSRVMLPATWCTRMETWKPAFGKPMWSWRKPTQHRWSTRAIWNPRPAQHRLSRMAS